MGQKYIREQRIVAAVSWAVVGLGSAVASTPDNRVAVDPNTPGNEYLKPIGMVMNSASKVSGTGFLVSKCHVLTNRHIVGGSKYVVIRGEQVLKEDTTKEANGKIIEFQIGYDSNNPSRLKISSMGTVIGSGDGGDLGDWALVKLDKNLGNQYGEVTYDGISYPAGKVVTTAGFPWDKYFQKDRNGNLVRDTTMWEENGKLLKNKAYWIADLNILGGQSGSPVFVELDGEQVVVGLVKGSQTTESKSDAKSDHNTTVTSGKIVPLAGFVEDINKLLKQSPCN